MDGATSGSFDQEARRGRGAPSPNYPGLQNGKDRLSCLAGRDISLADRYFWLPPPTDFGQPGLPTGCSEVLSLPEYIDYM